MIDREKLLAGLEYCETVGCCNECPYPAEWITENCPKCEIHRDAAAALREDADDIAMKDDTIHNLRLYLKEALVDTGEANLLERRHPGLPGYVPDQ